MQKMMIALSGLIIVSACGSTTSDRALSGAGIGAGIGMVGGAIAGGNPAAGAAVGGAVGGVVGAVVDETQIDLGKPIWE